MDINKCLAELKQSPGYAENVGMTLIHHGTVRAWSRDGHKKVDCVHVTPNKEMIQDICREMEKETGIFKIIAQANEGTLKPGDDLLFLVVAGDIRENVKKTFSDLLDRIKKEAVVTKESLS